MRTTRIGAGTGFSGDRIESAVELAERGRLGYLVFECLAAHPFAEARRIADIAAELGLPSLKLAAVLGEDVLDATRARNPEIEETRGRVSDFGDRVVCANAYIGAEPIVAALSGGADIVATGRMARVATAYPNRPTRSSLSRRPARRAAEESTHRETTQ
jgi:hypothetical protein